DGEDTTSRHASYEDAVSIVTESDVLVYGLRYPGSDFGIGMGRPWPRSPIPNMRFPFPFPWPPPRTGGGGGGRGGGGGGRWPHGGGGGMGNGDFMKDVTEAGGGPVYDAEQVSDMSRLASRIAEELRHVYVLSYYPKNPLSNGGY